ncbi:MAG: hypothetical protein Q9203_003226 [Teloschistes exilis]
MSPTILFVPGFWEGPEPFTAVSSLLSKKDYQTVICQLPSTGNTSPGNPGMHDDKAAIRSSIEAVIAESVQVVLVAHSGGGFLGSNAIEGLSAKARTEPGLEGGVVGIVFLTAALFPEDEAVANEWVGKLKCQPASGWDDTITFCGWKEIPSVYLICEGDQAILAAVQLQMAESAGSKIEKCSAGHMVILSMPEKVVAVIEAAVASF